MPELKVYRGSREMTRFQFTSEFNVGRGGTNDFNVPDSRVSRRHFTITQQNNQWILKDHSGAGIVVDGRRQYEIVLCDGSDIHISNMHVFFYKEITVCEPSTDRTKGEKTKPIRIEQSEPSATPVNLHVIAGNRIKIVPFAGQAITVGSGNACTVKIDDPLVSGKHLEIKANKKNKFQVTDLDSRNGTYIGQVEIREAVIPLGCFIQIGSASLVPRLAVSECTSYEGMIGDDESMIDVYHSIEHQAPTKLPVLILGETGSGKDLVARAIHKKSTYHNGPFVSINCGAINGSLQDSSLFGHERGAFTGAVREHKGAFEQADGGTLFLDEIGELTPSAQAALLHIIETHEVRRLGTEKSFKVNVRIVAATNKNLREMVDSGEFREDLYWRVRVACIQLPPLRARGDDLRMLIKHYLQVGAPYAHVTLSEAAERKLLEYWWPGNVRELIGVLGTTLSGRKSDYIDADDVVLESELRERWHKKTPGRTMVDISGKTLKQLKDEIIRAVYRGARGDPDEFAAQLGIKRAMAYRYIAVLRLVTGK